MSIEFNSRRKRIQCGVYILFARIIPLVTSNRKTITPSATSATFKLSSEVCSFSFRQQSKTCFMKKNLFLSFLLLASVLATVISCSKQKADVSNRSATQKEEIQTSAAKAGAPGRDILIAVIDVYNLHRPKFMCTQGFFFCHIYVPIYVHVDEPGPSFGRMNEDGTVQFWAMRVDDQLEFHFPIDLKNVSGYTDEDLKVFSVDEEFNAGTEKEPIIVQRGEYKTNFTDKEIIVSVPIVK